MLSAQPLVQRRDPGNTGTAEATSTKGKVLVKVLWVFAHPDSRSLSGSLFADGLRTLDSLGHSYQVSDLYAMKWKAVVDGDDYEPDSDARLIVSKSSEYAYRSGSLSPDVRAEQSKIMWADTIIFQFPLWWYSVPAILKGWFDRVFVKGFAYGVRDPEHPERTLRYGDGKLAGKRALTIVTSGSPKPALGPRGINGQLDEVLFPLLHGTFWYTGLAPLPPLGIYGADRVSDEQYLHDLRRLHRRLEELESTEPLAYRYQNRGDYDDDLVLRSEYAPGRSGLSVHYR